MSPHYAHWTINQHNMDEIIDASSPPKEGLPAKTQRAEPAAEADGRPARA